MGQGAKGVALKSKRQDRDDQISVIGSWSSGIRLRGEGFSDFRIPTSKFFYSVGWDRITVSLLNILIKG
jgi:hypothetical protein